MKRGGPLKRTPLRRTTAASLVRKAMTRGARKTTGFDRATTARIIDRDQRCVVATRCRGERDPRRLIGNHIVNRGNGGTSDPAVNAVDNGIACCWACNGWLEDFPLVAYRFGWKRRHGTPPGPVLYPDGLWYRLMPEGQRLLVPAPDDAPPAYPRGDR